MNVHQIRVRMKEGAKMEQIPMSVHVHQDLKEHSVVQVTTFHISVMKAYQLPNETTSLTISSNA